MYASQTYFLYLHISANPKDVFKDTYGGSKNKKKILELKKGSCPAKSWYLMRLENVK